MNSINNYFDNELSLDIWNRKYRVKNESFDNWLNRVTNSNQQIKDLILKKKFLFGGRILSNRGTNRGSLSNCYSVGYVKDSLEEILKTNTQLALTYKAQGGQGLSLTNIRPKGSPIKEGMFYSDGIVPFMEMFNTTTHSISQGNSRRGALLISLNSKHKEIETFISIKSKEKNINNANLSVEIDDDFMWHIQNWYVNGVRSSLIVTQKYDSGEQSYLIYPIDIYKKIVEYAYKYAEPGVLFMNRLHNYNIMEKIPNYKIETTNPCGEQPLPRHGSCFLSSFNLSEYVVNPFTDKAVFDIVSFTKDVGIVVEAMDEMIEENIDNHPLIEQSEVVKKYRNIGIGVMGLADMLVKLNIVYGSEKAVSKVSEIMGLMFRSAVIKSSELAKFKGSFPGYTEDVYDSQIMKNHFSRRELSELKNNGLRNCSLLTVAPTGTIATMLNISTGVEPFFALSYKRKTISLNNKDTIYDVNIKCVDEYRKIESDLGEEGELPLSFITSKNISWIDRINMQAAMQNSVDSAISSTVNLPEHISIDEVEQIYYYAWYKGLKGLTIYREGSRSPILAEEDTEFEDFPTHSSPKRPKKLPSQCYISSSRGKKYAIIIGLYKNKPYELFSFQLPENSNIVPINGYTIKVKKGSYKFESEKFTIDNLQESNDNIEERSNALYISMLLRHGVGIPFIIKTAKKVDDNIVSFSSAICRILSKYIPDEITDEKCPECGTNLTREGGCKKCPSCGYSKCLLCVIK